MRRPNNRQRYLGRRTWPRRGAQTLSGLESRQDSQVKSRDCACLPYLSPLSLPLRPLPISPAPTPTLLSSLSE